MDDALCLLFAFAALPRTKAVKGNVVADCRRLTAEFMHYVIESHSLTKVKSFMYLIIIFRFSFLSKGYITKLKLWAKR